MKFLISLIVLLSLLFLFGGLLAVGVFSNNKSTNKQHENKFVAKTGPQPASENYSMKQIDSLTAKYNTYFTAANANGSAYYP
jgi:hypothetical protein